MKRVIEVIDSWKNSILGIEPALTQEAVDRQVNIEVEEILQSLKNYDGGRMYGDIEFKYRRRDFGNHESLMRTYPDFDSYLKALIRIDIHNGRGGKNSLLLNHRQHDAQIGIFFGMIEVKNPQGFGKNCLVELEAYPAVFARTVTIRHRAPGITHVDLKSRKMAKKLKEQNQELSRLDEVRAREAASSESLKRAEVAEKQYRLSFESSMDKLKTFDGGEKYKKLMRENAGCANPQALTEEYIKFFVEKDLKLSDSSSLLKCKKYSEFMDIITNLKVEGADDSRYAELSAETLGSGPKMS